MNCKGSLTGRGQSRRSIGLRILLVLAISALAACGGSSPPAPQATAAWLGEGVFKAKAGDLDVQIQLELLADGSYRWLILEPRIMMVAGMEKGDWVETDSEIRLEPLNGSRREAPGSGQLIAKLREGAGPIGPRSLRVQGEYEALLLATDKFQVSFRLNEEATSRLRALGEI